MQPERGSKTPALPARWRLHPSISVRIGNGKETLIGRDPVFLCVANGNRAQDNDQLIACVGSIVVGDLNENSSKGRVTLTLVNYKIFARYDYIGTALFRVYGQLVNSVTQTVRRRALAVLDEHFEKRNPWFRQKTQTFGINPNPQSVGPAVKENGPAG